MWYETCSGCYWVNVTLKTNYLYDDSVSSVAFHSSSVPTLTQWLFPPPNPMTKIRKLFRLGMKPLVILLTRDLDCIKAVLPPNPQRWGSGLSITKSRTRLPR